MRSKQTNIVVLLALWMVTIGAGTYVTFFQQPEKLIKVDEAENALALERSEFRNLALLEGRMREEIQFATHRWEARYKNIGDSLSTADVVGYVNKFADRGFRSFGVEFSGLHFGPNHQYYAFAVRGSGPFNHLYDFVWHMENNRDLYRVEDLVIDQASGGSAGDVQFTFRLLAYFGTSAAISAAAVSRTVVADATISDSTGLPMVPDDVLPARRLAVDPFAAGAVQPAPTQTAGNAPSSPGANLFSLRDAKLVSIIGEIAMFDRSGSVKKVQVGDVVREGRVVQIDPSRQRVTIDGPSGTVHIDMDIEPLYRRFIGSKTAIPVRG